MSDSLVFLFFCFCVQTRVNWAIWINCQCLTSRGIKKKKICWQWCFVNRRKEINQIKVLWIERVEVSVWTVKTFMPGICCILLMPRVLAAGTVAVVWVRHALANDPLLMATTTMGHLQERTPRQCLLGQPLLFPTRAIRWVGGLGCVDGRLLPV